MSLKKIIRAGQVAAILLGIFAVGYGIMALVGIISAIAGVFGGDSFSDNLFLALLFLATLLLAVTPFFALREFRNIRRSLASSGDLPPFSRLKKFAGMMAIPTLFWTVIYGAQFVNGEFHGESIMHILLMSFLFVGPAILAAIVTWSFVMLTKESLQVATT